MSLVAAVAQRDGFHLPIAARKREWDAPTGRANFVVPRSLDDDIAVPEKRRDELQLMTVRSYDQFNTIVYGYNDRFHGRARHPDHAVHACERH